MMNLSILLILWLLIMPSTMPSTSHKDCYALVHTIYASVAVLLSIVDKFFIAIYAQLQTVNRLGRG